MSRVLLILPTATYRAPDFLEAARALQAEVVVASEEPQAMAGTMGDRALLVDLCDPEIAGRTIAMHGPFDAIVGVDDRGVLAAAHASKALGLPANPPEAVARTRDKALMRAAFGAGGVPQPAHTVVRTDGDLAAVGFPCVVKPLPLSGSRGVIRANTPDEAEVAAKRVRAILAAAGEDPDGDLLVEQFVPGVEVAVEGLLRHGELDVLAVFDKPDPLDGPYFEETIYVTPSRLPRATLDRVHAITADAARALGLTDGPVHAEMRIDRDEVRVLEVAARSIGGLCSRTLRFGLGVSLEELILRHSLGLPVGRMQASLGASGVMMIPIPRSGTLRHVNGLEGARAVPGIRGAEITILDGRPVQALPEGDRYLGFLFASGDTPADVEAALRAAHAGLEVVID